MPMDPRRVLTFREVARHRSFSRAAEALSLTQSAVSQQVAALERQLGTRLLDRRPGGLRLTSAGEQLLEHAGAIADRLTLADAQIAEEVAAERRELRIGAFPSALATIVPAAVAALPPRHRLRRRRRIALSDLARDPWTAPSRDGLIARACARAGFTPRIAYLSSDPLSIRAIIAAGLAVALTPRLLANHLHGVRIASVRDEPARRDVYALLPDAGARTTDE